MCFPAGIIFHGIPFKMTNKFSLKMHFLHKKTKSFKSIKYN